MRCIQKIEIKTQQSVLHVSIIIAISNMNYFPSNEFNFLLYLTQCEAYAQ